jgi:hypothetical protein
MTHGQSKAHWCSIVEDVKNIPIQPEKLGKALHYFRQMIKAVCEGFPIGGLAEAKTWQVRRHYVTRASLPSSSLILPMS